MARDNFSKKDIITLRTRVGDRCSNPDCRIVTIGPSSDPDKTTILGDAAHICAASKGGPRYDPKMTSDERKSINNGIWLCKACARRIDVDYKSYPKKLLHEWKFKAEKTAAEELNKPLFNQAELNNQIVSSAFAMINGISTTNAYNLVHHAIQVETKILETKDPRFKIVHQLENNCVNYHFLPKEPVSITMSYLGVNPAEFKNKHSAFIKHGRDFILNSEDISFSGSELFKYLETKSGTIHFSRPKKDACIKFWTVENNTNIITNFNDIIGRISFGTESFSFAGKGFGDMIKIEIQYFRDNTSKMSLNVSLKKWEQKNILMLPYFSKLWEFFNNIEHGSSLYFSLEVDGNAIMNSIQAQINKNNYFHNIYTFLQYTNYCRLICMKLDAKVMFTQISFTAEEHQEIAETELLLRKGIKSNELPDEPYKMTFVANQDNRRFLKGPLEITSVKLYQKEGDYISLFGKNVQLPPKCITLKSVLPKVLVDDVDSLVDGDIVELVMEPKDGYEYLMECKMDTSIKNSY